MRLLFTLACLLLTAGTLCFADAWTYFYPESVIRMTCSVQLVDMSASGGPRQDVWQADAHADRNNKELGNWEMTIGFFPPTVKGRHQAERECSKWMDAAGKRVRAAR